ncbi:MAG: NAD-dependent succinate-semialdehyde dehydrogenase [Candidatus Kapaibacterium sp.]
MSFFTYNPATGEKIKEYHELSTAQINGKLIKAEKAHQSWKKTTFTERSKLMLKAAEVLKNKKNDYARLMSEEMGKPFKQGIAEAEKCGWVCEYYAENAERFLADMNIKTEASKSYAAFNPLGPVLAIMPWNFPFWQVFRFAAPALMAGNAGLLKHSRNTMQCAIEIENVFLEAGFPEGLFSNLVIGSGPVADIIKDPIIKGVTLTGSTPVGKKVAAEAGANLKKTVLELGGSDPYIVLNDADVELAAEACVTGRLINSGQSCIAAKRFIVEKGILEEFTSAFVEKMKAKRMGAPMEEGIDIGPQARGDLRDDLHRQVKQSIEKGADLLLGGEVPDMPGYYYPATVLANVQKGMPAYDEETFGPVAAIIPAENEADAIEKANDSIFGLGGAVFSRDTEKAERMAREEIITGTCAVNDFVRSDPRLPFGGVKESGYGRELSEFGIREFVNIKTVYLK